MRSKLLSRIRRARAWTLAAAVASILTGCQPPSLRVSLERPVQGPTAETGQCHTSREWEASDRPSLLANLRSECTTIGPLQVAVDVNGRRIAEAALPVVLARDQNIDVDTPAFELPSGRAELSATFSATCEDGSRVSATSSCRWPDPPDKGSLGEH